MLKYFAILILSCGIPEDKGDGFVSDYNKCEWLESDGYYGGSTSIPGASDYEDLNDSSANNYLGQRFDISDTKQLWGVSLYLKTTATEPATGVYAVIYESNSNDSGPNTDKELGRTEIYTFTEPDTSGGWYNLQFDSIPHLVSNETYWVVLSPVYSENASSYVSWGYDSGGSLMYKTSSLSSSWSSLSQGASYKFMPCR